MRLGSIHSNLAALTRTTSAIDRALRRLSTGNRVARPGDDIAAYSQSVQLDSQVRGIYAGLTGLRTERSQTELADNAITSQLEIVQRMREIALQASNSLISATDRAALETELKSLLKDFERFTQQAREQGPSSLNEATSSDYFFSMAGTGTYLNRVTIPTTFGLTANPTDLNGDGNVDLFNAGGVAFGNGSGLFSAAHTQPGTFLSAQIADLNGDGSADMIGYTSDSIVFALNDGRGTFSTNSTFIPQAGDPITGFSFGDVDGDGDIDVVTTGAGSTVTVMVNDGSGTFTLGSSFEDNGLVGFGVEVVDLNNDGLKDIVTYDTGYHLGYYLSQGDGTFAAEATITSVVGSTLTSGDLDGDGDPDLIVYNVAAGAINVIRNNGSSWTTSALTTFGSSHRDVRIADMNNDGLNDILALSPSNDFVTIYLASGVGSFSAGYTLSVHASANRLFVGDATNDGVLDILTTRSGALDLFVARSTETSALPAVSVATEEKATELLKILDRTFERLSEDRAQMSALHSKLDVREASELLLAETLSDAKANLLQADLALETAELVRLQILQDAQVAVRAQENLQLQLILRLLQND